MTLDGIEFIMSLDQNLDQDNTVGRGMEPITVEVLPMLILSVSEAKRQIKDLVEQVGRRNQVFYITRYSRPKVVMLSVDQYESLVGQVNRLQGELAAVSAALDAHIDDTPILLPTPEGGMRAFQPRRPVSSEVRDAIRRAAQMALAQRDRTTEQVIQDGRAALGALARKRSRMAVRSMTKRK
ncbi:MAG: type II toxin-antitoxin system Phd/YefM family antitoxin [Anaerolineae bacterium]|nr:type II toxin-antitoxin system Phd/YefM family antitoxin [Anaerolineae bacterium]